MKSSTHSIVGAERPCRFQRISVDPAMLGERVLGEFSTVIALAVNRARCVHVHHSTDLEREGLSMRPIKHVAAITSMVVWAASANIGAPAHATGSSGLSVSNYVTGHYGPVNENTAQNKTGKWGMILKTLDDTDIGVDELTFQPGGYTGEGPAIWELSAEGG